MSEKSTARTKTQLRLARALSMRRILTGGAHTTIGVSGSNWSLCSRPSRSIVMSDNLSFFPWGHVRQSRSDGRGK